MEETVELHFQEDEGRKKMSLRKYTTNYLKDKTFIT